MKYVLLMPLLMSCLYSCSQSYNMAGEYESKNGTGIFLLKLYPSGAFHFDSYTNGFSGLPAEPSISGRGTWIAESEIIHFTTNPETDIDHNYTLNFNGSKAKFKKGFSKDSMNEKASATLEFVESGIFWINGMELTKRIN